MGLGPGCMPWLEDGVAACRCAAFGVGLGS